jgi:putative DNA methylase
MPSAKTRPHSKVALQADPVSTPIKSPRKLIEVALPLDDINVAAAREKSIRHGHPSTLHLWWARRPLAAARAVIFAQMVNDPGYGERGYYAGNKKAQADAERERAVRHHARAGEVGEHQQRSGAGPRPRGDAQELARDLQAQQKPPAGGRAVQPREAARLPRPLCRRRRLPLEAQRLGLEATPAT